MLKDLASAALSEDVSADEFDLRVADFFNAAFAGLSTQEAMLLLQHQRQMRGNHVAAVISAISRLTETDDIHLPSCVTPGAVVIPVALALSHELNVEDDAVIRKAVAAGYSVGLRVGMGIGGARAMEAGVWPTLLVAPMMAATTAAVLRGGDVDAVANAMALSLAGQSGRIGRPGGASTSRWLHFADAVGAGIAAESAAVSGFRGDLSFLSPAWLAAQSSPHLINAGAVTSSVRPSIKDVGFKPFATARQCATAVEAFANLLTEEGLGVDDISQVIVEVPQPNHLLISRPLVTTDRLSTLSNASFQIAAAAVCPDVLFDVARSGETAPDLLAFASKVDTAVALDLDADWPDRWAGRVTVTAKGRKLNREVRTLSTDTAAATARGSVRGKIERMQPYRPCGLPLHEGDCSTATQNLAIWNALLGCSKL